MKLNVKFPYLYPHQKDVFAAIKEDDGLGLTYVVKAKRQCGKSILAITLLLYFAFGNEGSTGYCLEPTLHQGRLLFKNLINSLGGEDSPAIKSSNATLLEVEFVNGSRILFRSAEQKQALRGATVRKSILIIDEAAFIEDEIIDILQPIVDANKCPVLFLSTPLFESGRFYERYMEGLKENGFTLSFDWGKYDLSEFLSPEKLEHYRETLAPLKFKSEILGEFISEGSYVFGDIFQCVGGYSTKPAVYAGVDWSAGGDGDYTVITFIDEDNHVTGLKWWKDFDSVDLVEELATEIAAHSKLKRVKVERNAIGKIFYDMLKRKTKPGLVQTFVTTNDSKREIIDSLISAFQTGDIQIPKEPELIKELQHYASEKTPGGKITYNASDGCHDDFVMSLAIAYSNAPATKTENKIRIALI